MQALARVHAGKQVVRLVDHDHGGARAGGQRPGQGERGQALGAVRLAALLVRLAGEDRARPELGGQRPGELGLARAGRAVQQHAHAAAPAAQRVGQDVARQLARLAQMGELVPADRGGLGTAEQARVQPLGRAPARARQAHHGLRHAHVVAPPVLDQAHLHEGPAPVRALVDHLLGQAERDGERGTVHLAVGHHAAVHGGAGERVEGGVDGAARQHGEQGGVELGQPQRGGDPGDLVVERGGGARRALAQRVERAAQLDPPLGGRPVGDLALEGRQAERGAVLLDPLGQLAAPAAVPVMAVPPVERPVQGVAQRVAQPRTLAHRQVERGRLRGGREIEGRRIAHGGVSGGGAAASGGATDAQMVIVGVIVS